MDEIKGGWNGGFSSVNFHDYSSLHPSVINYNAAHTNRHILGGTAMPLKFEMVDDIMAEDARDEMTDKFTACSDFIKSGVMELVELMQKRTNYPVKAFEAIARISQDLDEMWEVYAGLGYAYSTLLEKYKEATKETE